MGDPTIFTVKMMDLNPTEEWTLVSYERYKIFMSRKWL